MEVDLKNLGLKKNIFSFCVGLCLSLLIYGCASVSNEIKNMAEPLISVEKHLKKKVSMASVGNISEARDSAIANGLNQLLTVSLSNCETAIVVKPENDEALKSLTTSATGEAGELDNLTLSEKGRRMGLNAIVAATIVGIQKMEKKGGFMWFEGSNDVAGINVRVDVYNTFTGAKMMHEHFKREIELSEADIPIFDSGKIMEIESFSKAMGQISKDIGKSICKVLKNEPWKGLVVSSKNGKAVLSSGEDVGINVGDKFIVYDKFNIVNGINGHRYRIPGEVTDELEITSVGPDRAEGAVLSGSTVLSGSIVQFKKK